MKAGYVIKVGLHAPEKVIIAVPDRDRKPMEDTIIEAFRQNDNTLIINRARVWARRVAEDGKPAKNEEDKDQVLEITDRRYKGHLEFLKWGDNKTGAQAIEIMWLSNSMSLDYDYQRKIQGLEPTNEQAQILLRSGENKFDYKKEALLIEMLKVHPQNRDSVSKNPDPFIKGFTYFEVTDEQTDKAYVKNKEAAITSGLFVTQLSTKPQQLRNLFEIFKNYGVNFGDVNHLSNDTDIYTALLKFADQPGEFGSQVNRYKQELYEKFELAKSYKALDLTKNGYIAFLLNNKPEIVFENAKGKGDAMIDWVLENFVDDYVYKQSQYFKALCNKLK